MGEEAEARVLVAGHQERQLPLPTLDSLGVLQLYPHCLRLESQVVPGEVEMRGEHLPTGGGDEAGKAGKGDPQCEEEAAPDRSPASSRDQPGQERGGDGQLLLDRPVEEPLRTTESSSQGVVTGGCGEVIAELEVLLSDPSEVVGNGAD